jgi:lipoprotein signal peptidase
MTVTPKLSISAEHTPGVLRSLALLVAGATVLAAVDLAHKAAAGPVFVHERSALYAVGIGLVCLAWAGGVVLLRSPSVALAAGPLVGGAVGNGVSLAIWPGVPNPILVDTVAFNVADVGVAIGLGLLLLTTISFAVRNRDRLSDPI